MIVYMALMKSLQESGVAALDICFLRSAFGFVHAFSVLKWRGEEFYPKAVRENPSIRNALLGRSICGVIAYISFVFAVARLPLGLISTIDKTSPIWAGLIATVFLQERLSVFEWTCMACSFSGIIVIFLTANAQTTASFSQADFNAGLCFITTTSVFAAIIGVLTRKM